MADKYERRTPRPLPDDDFEGATEEDIENSADSAIEEGQEGEEEQER